MIIPLMKKRNYSLSLFLVALMILIFTGCEDFFLSEAENVDIPGSEPQLVVNSFISPQDSLIKVYVHRSIPHTIASDEVPPVNGNADVYIAPAGGEFIQLSYDYNLKAFTVSATVFPVEAGNYYQLKVESFGGEMVEAECFVPEYGVENVAFEDVRIINDNWGGMEMLLGWTVKPSKTNEINYFRTGGFVRSYQVNNYGNNDTVFVGSQELWLERGNEFFTDEEGALYNFKGEFYGWWNFNGSSGQNETYQTIDSVFVFVLQTDFPYYRFHQSVEDYFYYGDDFPFAESVHIYSNIVGGLGAFGGYNKKNYMIRAFTPENN